MDFSKNKIFHFIVQAFLLVPFIISILYTLGLIAKSASEQLDIVLFSVLFFSILWCAIFFAVKSKILSQWNITIYFVIVFGFALIAGITSILFYKAELISDPKLYNQTAIDFVNGTLKIDGLSVLLLKRSILYLVPIYYIFGYKAFIVIKIANLIFFLASGYFIYRIMSFITNNLIIIRLSLIIFFSFPVCYLYLNTVTHDIVGIFYLTLFLLNSVVLIKAIHKNNLLSIKIIIHSLISGILLVACEWQRSLGILLIPSILIYFIVHITPILKLNGFIKSVKKNIAISVFFVIIPLLIYLYVTSNYLTNKSEYYDLDNMLFSYNNTKFSGRYNENAEFRNKFFNQLQPDEKSDYAKSIIFSGIYFEYDGFVTMMFRKMKELTGLGDQYYYVSRLENKKSKDNLILKWSLFYGYLIRLMIFSCVIVYLIWSFRKLSLNNFLWLPHIFSLLFLYTLLISEVNSRYMIILLPVISLTGAFGLENLSKRPTDSRIFYRFLLLRLRFTIVRFISVFIFFLVLLAIIYCGTQLYLKDHELKFSKIFIDNVSILTPNGNFVEVDKQELEQKTSVIESTYRSPSANFEYTASDASFKIPVTREMNYSFSGFINKNNFEVKFLSMYLIINGYLIKTITSSDSLNVIYFKTEPIYCPNDTAVLEVLISSGIAPLNTIKGQKFNYTISYLIARKEPTPSEIHYKIFDRSQFEFYESKNFFITNSDMQWVAPLSKQCAVKRRTTGEYIFEPISNNTAFYLWYDKSINPNDFPTYPVSVVPDTDYSIMIWGKGLQSSFSYFLIFFDKTKRIKQLVFSDKNNNPDTLKFKFTAPENAYKFKFGIRCESGVGAPFSIDSILMARIIRKNEDK